MVGVKRLINHSCSGDIGDVLKGFLVSVINICFVIIFCNLNQPISIIWSSIVTLISLACYALTTPHVSHTSACSPQHAHHMRGRDEGEKERKSCLASDNQRFCWEDLNPWDRIRLWQEPQDLGQTPLADPGHCLLVPRHCPHLEHLDPVERGTGGESLL